ncbi:MAG: response regulator [Chitinispirillaceae bacterium]|nr:response regulator [Chitinispirillaceae bacterium]
MVKKILVIEDDRDIADLVKLVLETTNLYEVFTVLDPLKAYETAVEYRPDAILLDLSMPKMDGWTIFDLIKKDERLSNIPIAILTARSQDIDEIIILHVKKADAYIAKPFGKQELIEKTNGLFKKRDKQTDTHN